MTLTEIGLSDDVLRKLTKAALNGLKNGRVVKREDGLFPSDEFLDKVGSMTIEELQTLYGIGKKTAKTIYDARK